MLTPSVSHVSATVQWYKMSCLVRKPTMWFLNRSDTNQAVQAQKMATGMKFWI